MSATATKKRVKVTEAEIVDNSRPIEDIMKDFTPSVSDAVKSNIA